MVYTLRFVGHTVHQFRPAMFALGGVQFVVPYLYKLGPPALRRWALDHLLPDRRVQHLKDIADFLDSQARSIISKKRLALKEGDEAVTQQVGEGKDIMSILSIYRPKPRNLLFAWRLTRW